MKSNWKEKIKELSKDENAQQKLEQLFTQLQEERDKFESHVELLEAAIENDYDSILITNLNLEEPGPRILYVNDGFEEMTGYSRDEVIGKTPRILQGPKTDRAVLDRLKNRLKKGKAFFGQAVNYRKDGSEFINQWDIHPLTDEEGNLTHWVSYQHDITERKRAERMLIDTDQEFDQLRESSHKTIVDVDMQGNVVMTNKSFRDLVGYSKDELKKIKVWDLFPKKFRSSLKKRFDDGADETNFGGRQFKGIIRHRTGVAIQVQGKTELLDLKEGTLIRAEVDNISMQKRIIDTLKQRNQNFARIFNQASEFTYRLKINNDEPVFEAVSEEFPVFTGISPEKVQQKGGYKEFIHAADVDKVKDHFKEALKGKSCTCTYRVKNAEDEYVEVVDYAKPEFEGGKESIAYICGAVSLAHNNKATV